MYPNRTVCEVLKEMRKLDQTRNYAGLEGLIEETQSMVNRMEAALMDKSDLRYARDRLKEVRKKIIAAEKDLETIEETK